EDAVVEQHGGELLASCGAVDDLLQALVHHVAVTLEGEHEPVGQDALGAGRHRRRAAVQRLENVDIADAGKGRVAADAADADRAIAQIELVDQLEDRTQGERVAAAGAERGLGGEQQVRLGGHLLQRRGRGHAAAFPSYTSVMRRMIVAGSSNGPTPKPEWSWLMPPMAVTGARPSTARRTSSIICPAFCSKTAIARTRDAAATTTSAGNGHRVMGRMHATLRPRAGHCGMAYLTTRAGEPKATTATSASSSSPVSQRFSLDMRAHFSLIALKCAPCSRCIFSGEPSGVTLWARRPHAPVAAQGLGGRSLSRRTGNSTASDVCPRTKSPSTSTGVRHWPPSWNASAIRSTASCTVCGASTRWR